jgi:hypothetical protein
MAQTWILQKFFQMILLPIVVMNTAKRWGVFENISDGVGVCFREINLWKLWREGRPRNGKTSSLAEGKG